MLIDGADAAVFKNAYTAKGTTVIIGATKTLEGRTLAAGEFTFKLTGADGRTYEAKNAADGRIEFPAIDFDKVGTYDFTLVEMNDGQTGITYDDRSYKVTVVVTDDGKGNLGCECDLAERNASDVQEHVHEACSCSDSWYARQASCALRENGR